MNVNLTITFDGNTDPITVNVPDFDPTRFTEEMKLYPTFVFKDEDDGSGYIIASASIVYARYAEVKPELLIRVENL